MLLLFDSSSLCTLFDSVIYVPFLTVQVLTGEIKDFLYASTMSYAHDLEASLLVVDSSRADSGIMNHASGV